jgi:hypothetical protein
MYIDNSVVLYSQSKIPQAWGHEPKNVWIARVGQKTYQATSLELLQDLVSDVLGQFSLMQEIGSIDKLVINGKN